MCTVNSLAAYWLCLFRNSSCRTVLIACLVCWSLDSSSAHAASPSGLNFQLDAPPDITIQIKRTQACDTLFNMPAASVSYAGSCPTAITFTTSSIFTSLNTNGGLMYFPTGVYKVVYTVTDHCGMSARDSSYITIYDASVPNLVCNPQQTINLPSPGFADIPASVFDAGSTDNCGHVYFKIKRMFNPSGYSCSNPGNPSNNFDDLIRFCCQDVDSNSIRVILRVYDVYPGDGPVSDSLHRGHYVDCMVQAIVLDKIAPDITCPYNVTVSCGADLDSVLLTMGAFITDNCALSSIDTIIDNQLDACGSGEIRRTFIATDVHRQQSSCTQIISVLKTKTFNGLDPNQLKWPDHKIVFACRIDPDTINAGIPIIHEDGCASVQTTKKDEKYNFDRGGVCAKILRYWYVIDWCQYNPNLKPNPNIAANGYYAYIQEIKIMDTVAPQLTGLVDTIVFIQSASCQPGMVILPNVTASDCGSTSNLTIHYTVDFNIDGQIDVQKPGNNAGGFYPLGRHLICFYANDSCHNTGLLKTIIDVRDGKAPSANAIYGLSSSLIQMATGPMVSISARSFNLKSSDNCTPESELRFSFSQDINDTLRIFTCDSIGKRDIHLYVWDLEGNVNNVTTFIVIDDVDKLCPTSIHNVNISGLVQTKNKQLVKSASANLIVDSKAYSVATDKNGYYSFSNVPANQFIKLGIISSQPDPSGISTADIIKIQRHILGIELLDQVEELLAADVDLSKSISTKDVAYIRNLILGKVTEFPSHKTYHFINQAYKFINPIDPFEELDASLQIHKTTTEDLHDLDFIAIKLGDVNQSYQGSNFKSTNSRFTGFKLSQFDNYINIIPEWDELIFGFQFEFTVKGLCAGLTFKLESSLQDFSEANYQIDGNVVRVSYAAANPFSSEFTLRIPMEALDQNCHINLKLSDDFSNEVYGINHTLGIDHFKNISTQLKQEVEFFPNPVSDQLFINLKYFENTDVKIELFDVSGSLVENHIVGVKNIFETIEFKDLRALNKGVYMLYISNQSFSNYYKIIAR